jgi:peptidoglycan DL-endopeptidase RipA
MMTCGLTTAVAAPPVNPTDGQISQAQTAKQALAAQVGSLNAQIIAAQDLLHQLSARVELAEQKLALAESQLRDAKTKAAAAQVAVTAAANAVTAARSNLTSFVRNTYMAPTLSSDTGNLLTASDPNALLQRGDYVRYVSDQHLDAVGALNRATVAQSNAVASAKTLVIQEQGFEAAAAAAQAAATQAYQNEQLQSAALNASLASSQTKLAAAQSALATLNGQRATYDAYVKEQKRLLAIKLEQERQARIRAAQQAAAVAAANAAAARAAQNAGSGSGSGSGSSSGGDATSLPPAGSMGSWTLAKGQAAANRATRWLGERYSWAAGNYDGPTYGINSPGTDGWNDSTVYGFDCSGLALYAWAPQGLYMAHYAATQYTQAGSVHPSAGNFEPGDLLFWSSDGSIGGIHHVAIYIGNGNVVQAPNSGDVVKITPWDQVDWGYFGATRPLT